MRNNHDEMRTQSLQAAELVSITALQLLARDSPRALSLIDGIAEALPKTDANSAEAVDHRLGNAKESVAEKWGFEMTYVGERLFLFLYASTKSILLLRMNRLFQKRYLYKMKLIYLLNIEILR